MSIELGGNIKLSGFEDFEGGEMVVVKKIVGSYAKKISESCKNFQELSVDVKPVHKKEGTGKFEIHSKVIADGKPVTSEITEINVFFAIDKTLKKIEEQLKK